MSMCFLRNDMAGSSRYARKIRPFPMRVVSASRLHYKKKFGIIGMLRRLSASTLDGKGERLSTLKVRTKWRSPQTAGALF